MREVNEGGGERTSTSRRKEKPSRLARQHRREARLRRRLLLGLLLFLAMVLAVGSVLDVPVIDFPRRAWTWVRERMLSSGEEGAGELPAYLFRTHPQTGKRLEGSVSVLLGVTGSPEGEGGSELLYLALVTFPSGQGGLDVYMIPEVLLAYDASGSPVRLRECLQRERGSDLLRSTVENLSGTEVRYLLLCDYRVAVLTMQSLELPPVVLGEDVQFRDPVSGETQTVYAGQRIGDTDRLLCYLLAADRPDYWDAYFRRVDRAKEYLPRALEALAAQEEVLPEEFPSSEGGVSLVPGTGSEAKDVSYLASMLQAAAATAGREASCRGVPRVDVLNGCGVPDLGRKVGERLADMGVPLGETGKNAKVVVNGEEVNDFSHQESLVICRSADSRALAFARFLGVQLSVDEVREELGPGVEVVVIAGRDLAS